MKAWFWLLLGLLAVTLACAQGYANRPLYQDPEAARTWYQNPETEEEYHVRMWDQEIRSHD